jgi:hypothetical protein
VSRETVTIHQVLLNRHRVATLQQLGFNDIPMGSQALAHGLRSGCRGGFRAAAARGLASFGFRFGQLSNAGAVADPRQRASTRRADAEAPGVDRLDGVLGLFFSYFKGLCGFANGLDPMTSVKRN